MFELINNIEVDRKNSLPVADLHARYRKTGTPVIFGDLTRRWPAKDSWSVDYLADQIGDVGVQIYSNLSSVNAGRPFEPVLCSSLSAYVEELLDKKNDLRVSNLALKSAPRLVQDIFYPRLGFDFDANLTSLGVGGKGAMEPMTQSSSIVHTVLCNFGERTSVQLFPPELSGFMYRVGSSQHTIRDINFDQPDFDKYPALRKLSGYVAVLNHGDALYIPSGFWYCVAYESVGITLSFESIQGNLAQYIGAISKTSTNRLANAMPFKGARLQRAEKQIRLGTNARLLKR